MKKSTFTRLIISLIGIVLIVCNIYFYSNREKIDYSIQIGTPISKERIDFSNPITNRNHAHTIQFSLINAISINMPDVTNRLPDATIKIDARDLGVTYSIIDAWIDGDNVIFKMMENSELGPQYKYTTGTWGEKYKVFN